MRSVISPAAAFFLVLVLPTFSGCANQPVPPSVATSSHTSNDESRGKLLYATHCSACHTSQIHWRNNKLATDWTSLLAQVRRWQTGIGLAWSKEEITDVARYLNMAFYGFQIPDADQKTLTKDSSPKRALQK